MGEVKNPEELNSIDDAFAAGLADEELKTSDDSPESKTVSSEGKEGEPKPDEGKKPDEDGKKDDAPEDGKKGDEPNKPDKGDKPDTKGEYTKERFDGLMSRWQKDISERDKKLDEMAQTLSQFKEQLENKKPQPEISDEDLPEEIRNADDETKQGFKLLMKAQEGRLSKLEKSILDKIQQAQTQPEKEKAETVTKIHKETEDLALKYGKEIEDNKKELWDYAAKNNYPLGTLEFAYKAWKAEKEATEAKEKLANGGKTLKEIEAEKKKDADIPRGGKGAGDEIPAFDPERDGSKTLDDIFEDVKTAMR